MSYEEGWSLDFCLACDNQTSEGAYCSQSCRLSDLDKGQPSFTEASHSPAPSQNSTLSSIVPSSTFGFFLRPAFDFTLSRKPYRTSSPSPWQESTRIVTSVQSQSWPWAAENSHQPRNDVPLGTASSRSSVSLDFNTPNAAASSSSQFMTQLSDDARQQLEIYDNSFDMTRHRKHRSMS